MIENKKKKVMQKSQITIVSFSDEDVITTSAGIPDNNRTHGQNDELSSFGLGGFFTSEDWYTDGHQD